MDGLCAQGHLDLKFFDSYSKGLACKLDTEGGSRARHCSAAEHRAWGGAGICVRACMSGFGVSQGITR